MNTGLRPGSVACGKIVILISDFIRAGSTRQAYLLSSTLKQKHGIDAEVWALLDARTDAGYAREFEAAGVPTRIIGFHRPATTPTRLLRSLRWSAESWRVIRQLKRAKVDVLLPFASWPNVVAGLTYRLAGVRLCIWGERHAGGDRVDPRPERVAVRQYRRFVANSTAGVEFLSGQLGIPRGRISLIPSGVDTPKQVRAKYDWRRERLRLKSGEPLVVMVGNFNIGQRDLPTLLRAWTIVQKNWTSGEKPFLALAGSRSFYHDDYQEALKIRRKEGLDLSLRFLDFTSDAPALIEASDLAVFSSRLEGMPDGVLECMAAGKAVVASDLPGIRDALGQNAGEVLSPVGDAERLARIMLDLLHSKKKRDALGEANRARTQSEFTVDAMAEQHLKLIADNLPNASFSRRRNVEILQDRAQA